MVVIITGEGGYWNAIEIDDNQKFTFFPISKYCQIHGKYLGDSLPVLKAVKCAVDANASFIVFMSQHWVEQAVEETILKILQDAHIGYFIN